jgi:SAM-dependent methyltransferase
MAATIQEFPDLLRLLGAGLELFHYSASDLGERYGDAYKSDAVFLFQKAEDFARACGDDLHAALASYRAWIERAAVGRSASGPPHAAGAGGRTAGLSLDDPGLRRDYFYALTLSTALNRSRYELSRHYRQSVQEHLRAGATTLEIGAGNCLDAALASRYGRVCAYEKNDLSRVWLRLLDLAGSVDLRIESYLFDQPRTFDLVVMIELLEHVADPGAYLEGAYRVLKDEGLAFLTFAVRMPQFDHLTDFASIEECRGLLADHGFAIRQERCLIDTYLPFEEADRWRLAGDSTHPLVYSCLVSKVAPLRESTDLVAWNEEIDEAPPGGPAEAGALLGRNSHGDNADAP